MLLAASSTQTLNSNHMQLQPAQNLVMLRACPILCLPGPRSQVQEALCGLCPLLLSCSHTRERTPLRDPFLKRPKDPTPLPIPPGTAELHT